MEKAPLEAGLEYCIDSWWVMYLEGQVIYIYHLGSECFCVGCNQNGGGGGSGNGNGSSPDANTDGTSNICPSSFPFSQYIATSAGVGGWQVAGTNGIHMSIVDFTTGQVVPLNLPTMYFGLPIVRSNGEYYSSSTASQIAADAVEYAETKVMEYYHSIGGNLNVVGMTLYYRQKMNEYMQTKGGSASLLPGVNINIHSIGNATYGWPIIGC